MTEDGVPSWSIRDPTKIRKDPEMIMFRERRSSKTHLQRRRSLVDIIDDFPTLDIIEKPEFRIPEVMCL